MREQFRPYTLVAELATLEPSSITLTDSAGTALKSNYVSVQASAVGGATLYSVILSSLNVSAGIADTLWASDMIGSISGVPGGTATTENGIVEFVLADNDRVSEITISQRSVDSVTYLINYGQVWTGNPLRDQERPKGD